MNIYVFNAVLIIITAYITYHYNVVLKVGMRRTHLGGDRGNLYAAFWIVVLGLEYGLRGDYLQDYSNYLTRFRITMNTPFSKIIGWGGELDWGYMFLNKLVSQFTSSFLIFSIFLAFLTIGLYFIAIYKMTDIVWVSLAVFVATGIFYGGFNLCSQFLASGIFAIAAIFIYKKKPILYFIMILCAMLIHKSAIFLLPMYIILRLKLIKNKKVFVIMTAFISLFFFISIDFLASWMSSFVFGNLYTKMAFEGQPLSYFIKNVPILGFVIYFQSEFNMENSKEKMMFIGTLLYGGVIFLSLRVNYIQRFAYYFVIFVMLACAHIIKKKGYSKRVLIPFFTLLFVMQIGWFFAYYRTALGV